MLNMQTIMWSKRRIVIFTISSLILFTLLKKRDYQHEQEVVIKNVKPQVVWEFIADFTNVKKHLIHHMEDFAILSESGNFDHWKYSVSYTEPLPVWPYFKTYAIGNYSITMHNNMYLISTTHYTYLFEGWFNSKSVTNMYISDFANKDTLYKEKLVYECPPLMKTWCRYTMLYTRQLFIDNLVNYFKK